MLQKQPSTSINTTQETITWRLQGGGRITGIKVRARGAKEKFGPRAEPVFGQIFGCEVSHFAIRRRARGVRSIRFLQAKTSARILILNSETLTGAHSSFSRISHVHNNFGETLVGRRGARNNRRLQRWRDATRSKRPVDSSDRSPRPRGNFLFPPPRRST